MNFQIEEVKTKNNTKLVIVIIIILLLVLMFSIGLGILAAKLWKKNTEEVKNNKEDIIIEKEAKSKSLQLKNKGQFVFEVNNIYNGKEGKRVFLTFDDGPSKNTTPHILDILKQNDIKATFFVVGNRAKNNTELLKREYNEGHYIANHSYSHKYSKIYSSSSKVLEEYNKTEAIIKKALNKPDYESQLFRFPGGSTGGYYNKVKKTVKKELAKNNIAYLDWNALTADAAGANTKKKIMKNLKQTVKNKNNVVLLMHDAPDKELTYKSLQDVINYLKKEGYAFKNMYDLVKMEE